MIVTGKSDEEFDMNFKAVFERVLEYNTKFNENKMQFKSINEKCMA